MKRITVLGIACVDVVVSGMQTLPQAGRLNQVEAITMHSGGCAMNVAIDLAKMGILPKISIPLAEDPFGQFLKETLHTYKLMTDQCMFFNPPAKTSASVVLVDQTGERSFLHDPGVNAVFSLEDLPTSLLDDTDILLVTGALVMKNFDGAPMATFLKTAQSRGIFTVLDTVDDPTDRWLTVLKPCLPYVDLFVPSEAEATRLSQTTDIEATIVRLREHGVKDMIIKLGAKGCLAALASKQILLPAVPVEQVVDTTGAGDAFVAGLLAGLAHDYPIETALKIALKTGAQAVTAKGATTGVSAFNFDLNKEAN